VITDILQETLAPRAARNKKSYVEDPQFDKNNNRKRRAVEAQEKPRRRSGRTVETVNSVPLVDGAVAQVREWSFGNIPKKDASRFVRAVIYTSIYLCTYLSFFCLSMLSICHCIVSFCFELTA
jgi:hypothetical protein